MNNSGLLHAYREHEQDLLRFLVKRVRCVFTAADLAQELYLKLCRLDGVTSIKNARAYLFQMAANLATDYRKIESRRSEILHEVHDLLWRTDNPHTPEHLLLARDDIEKLRTAISELPPLSRKIFYLNRFEGKPQRQIAVEFGVSTTTVETHIRRVLAHLQKAREEA